MTATNLPRISTPAQQRLLEELLALDMPRPAADLTLAGALRDQLESALAPIVEALPDGEQVYVGKSALDRLVCDGWYLDRQESPFTYGAAVARGTLAHRGIEVDWRTGGQRGPDALLAHVWEEMASDTGALADYLNGLDELEAQVLRHEAAQLVTEFRDTWPTVPPLWQPRLEARIRVRLGGGKVVLAGTPDLTLGRLSRSRCQMLIVDFKTGMRRPAEERQELRFYALLATLKFGVPPFRWATYYVAEGAWDFEDLAPGLIESAVRRVVDGVEQAVRLSAGEPSEGLQLRGGGWCRWCSRRDDCESAVTSEESGLW